LSAVSGVEVRVIPYTGFSPVRPRQSVYGLHSANLRGDILGGLTAAVIALPLALGMGVSSGAKAVAAVYGAVSAGLFAAGDDLDKKVVG